MTFSLDKCPRDADGHWLAQTRDGRKVRILIKDAKGSYPLMGLIEFEGKECAESWTACGKAYFSERKSEFDLVNVPVTRSVTVEVWEHPETHTTQIIDPTYPCNLPGFWRKVAEQTITWTE